MLHFITEQRPDIPSLLLVGNKADLFLRRKANVLLKIMEFPLSKLVQKLEKMLKKCLK